MKIKIEMDIETLWKVVMIQNKVQYSDWKKLKIKHLYSKIQTFSNTCFIFAYEGNVFLRGTG